MTTAEPTGGSLLAREWHTVVAPLLPLAERLSGRLVDVDDEQLRFEYYQAIMSQLVGGYLALFSRDPQHPDLWPYTTTGLTATLNNPDANYYLTPIEDTGVYRLSGFRGTVHKLDVQTGGGRWLTRGVVGDMEQAALRTYDLDRDAHLATDGSFEVVMSQERPVGYEGDWWQLAERTTYLMARQISYDWTAERDGAVAIDRVDVPAARPRRTTAQLQDDLRQLAVWVEGNILATLDFAALARKQGVNRLENLSLDISDTGFFGKPTQFYAYGSFVLGPDEALVLECAVPAGTEYWNIQVGDDLSFTQDWMNRQTSLNGASARVDPDGVLRVVISEGDPGVPNWLDTLGYRRGTLCARWEGCAAPPLQYASRVIDVDEVPELLPPETPRVTPAQRDAVLRARRIAVQLRKRW